MHLLKMQILRREFISLDIERHRAGPQLVICPPPLGLHAISLRVVRCVDRVLRASEQNEEEEGGKQGKREAAAGHASRARVKV